MPSPFESLVAAVVDDDRASVAALLARDPVLSRRGFSEKGGRTAFLDARVVIAGRRLSIEPLGGRGSHDVLSQSRRNALLMIPPEGATFRAGDMVSAVLLPDAFA